MCEVQETIADQTKRPPICGEISAVQQMIPARTIPGVMQLLAEAGQAASGTISGALTEPGENILAG